MAAYTIRVELEGNPSYQQYELLHQKMAAAGFSKTIRGGDGRTFALPHALYYGSSLSDASTVRSQVTTIAQSIQQAVIVFVAETTNWSMYGNLA